MEFRQRGRYLLVLYIGTTTEMRGLFFIGDFLFAKNEFIVKEEIENHDDYRREGKWSSSKDKFISKGQINGWGDIEGKFVKWGDKTKKLSKCWTDNDGK